MNMTHSGPHLVLLGHVIQEMIYFPERTIGPVLGSPVAYGALVAARLGERVGIVTTVGDDLPPQLFAPLREAQVDLRGVKQIPGPYTTLAELIYDRSGNKVIRYPQKAPPLQMEDVPPAYRHATIYYVATMDRDLPVEMVAQLAKLPGQVAVDLGGYGGAHSPPTVDGEPQSDSHLLQDLIRSVDLVRASVEDCQRIFPHVDMRDAHEQESILHQFLHWGAKLAVLTLGANGCLLVTSDGAERYPAFDTQVVDTTGAGDSFFTAFLVEYMHTKDIPWSVQFAMATVSYVIEQSGGVHLERMPTRSRVLARIAARVAG